MDVLSGLIIAVGVMSLVVVLTFTFAVWWIIRRARRALRKSRTVEHGLLVARARLGVGPAREIAALRVQLRAAIDSTTHLAATSDGLPTADIAPVLVRLRTAAQSVDADLRGLERDPNPYRQQLGLPLHRDEVNEIVSATSRIREAVAKTSMTNRTSTLSSVTADVDDHVEALKHYRRAYRELGGG